MHHIDLTTLTLAKGAWAALAPTVDLLQDSAITLLDQMIHPALTAEVTA